VRLLAVNYHYYRTIQTGSGIYPITPGQFDAQITHLAREWSIASEARMLEALQGGTPGDDVLCLITFDDGLKEQMPAVRWLIDRGYSAVCYVPTAPLVDRRVLAVHKLHIIRSLRSDTELGADLMRLFGATFSGLNVTHAVEQYPLDDADAQQVKYFLNFVLRPEESRVWIAIGYSSKWPATTLLLWLPSTWMRQIYVSLRSMACSVRTRTLTCRWRGSILLWYAMRLKSHWIYSSPSPVRACAACRIRTVGQPPRMVLSAASRRIVDCLTA
jgi:hypothetical protein